MANLPPVAGPHSARLFRYRLSYLIYSRSFEALPAPAKEFFYRRLLEILQGRDQRREFMAIPASEKQVIFEILRETSPEFVKISSTL